MNQTTSQPNEKLAQSYNDLPYPSGVFSHCSPLRLHALAKMKGLEPVPLENAKVLEIGCSFGGNLLPFALQFPNSFSVGIDLAEKQIQVGQQMLEQVGIKNIALIAADISKVQFEFKFDYIICHGVFSWVPSFIQQAILATIQQYLSPNGIAFISYNAYPGWKSKEIARDLMLFGSNADLVRSERTDQALGMINFTKEIYQTNPSVYYQNMVLHFDKILDGSKSYIAHEYLEDFNNPLYFRQFVNLISQFNLAYVVETTTPYFYTNETGEEKFDKICGYFEGHLDDITQYMDFIYGTSFRCDMITHKNNMERYQLSNRIEQFNTCQHFYELYIWLGNTILVQENGEEFWKSSNVKFKRNNTFDLIFNHLNKQQGSCQIQSILDNFKDNPEFDKKQAEQLMWTIVHSNYSIISYYPIESKTYGKKPKVSLIRRHLMQFIQANPDIIYHSTIWGQQIQISPTTIYFSQYLDGSKTIKGLIKQYKKSLKEDHLRHQTPDGDYIPVKEISDEDIEQNLMVILDELQYYGYFE